MPSRFPDTEKLSYTPSEVSPPDPLLWNCQHVQFVRILQILIDGTVAMRLYRNGNCTQFVQQIVCWFGMLSIVCAVFCHVNCGR